MAEAETWSASEAAARGAALLDEKVPGWHNEVRGAIRDGLFRMNDWARCVVGTVERITVTGLDGGGSEQVISFNGTRLVGEDEAAHYGFVWAEAPEIEDDGDLDGAWKREVEKRKPALAQN